MKLNLGERRLQMRPKPPPTIRERPPPREEDAPPRTVNEVETSFPLSECIHCGCQTNAPLRLCCREGYLDDGGKKIPPVETRLNRPTT